MNESKKVVLPKEVAEVIEYLREQGCDNFQVMRQIHGAGVTKKLIAAKRWAFDSISEGDPNLLMEALVNGYEVEETPEDKLRKYYEDYSEKERMAADCGGSYCGFTLMELVRGKQAIKDTLYILGITIEGIND